MRQAIRVAALVLLACVIASGTAPRPASAGTPGATPAPALVKLRQRQLMAEEPMRERQERREFRERARELRRLARRMRSSGASSLRSSGERTRPDPGDEDSRVSAATSRPSRAPAPPAAARAALALGPNVRCNDPSTDVQFINGQCETAIVRWNNYLLAAWNDGAGFADGSGQTQGWGTSVDGGVTWVDQGIFPVPSAYPSWRWTSDPVLAVNPTTGAFYYTGLADPSPSQSAVGVLKGRFTGASFAWEPASLVRAVPSSTAFLDKEWIAVDPADGRAYVTYTTFTASGDEIDAQCADSTLAAWSPFQMVSDVSENGWVQGSRPIVGPAGNVCVVYYRIGPVDADFFRVARSADRGGSYSAATTAVSLFSNWTTGAPGFNRPTGIQFPSIAVDRSGGPHDGRLYLAWNESLDWYDDVAGMGAGGSLSEVEPDDIPAMATPATIGQVLRGTVNGNTDIYDWYRFTLSAGQSVLASVDSLAAGVQVTLRMHASDGATRLTYMTATASDVATYGPAPMLYTAPTAGTYYLRVAASSGIGAYRVGTGPAARTTERGRDQRDVFTAYSDDGGVTWSTPVRVNNDPVGYDDWLPEIAVAPTGQVACAWFDWRDAAAGTCGGESAIYLAASPDGGGVWREQGAVTDVRSAWTAVQSNILPNEGDYMALFADAQGYAVAWSDGRDLNPNTYMAPVALATAGVADAGPHAFRLVAGTALAIASAHLAFDLPLGGRTRLAIFDLQGRKVATLADGPLGGGAHEADWNLADEAGQPVGAGVYWALLESGGRRASARLVVLR